MKPTRTSPLGKETIMDEALELFTQQKIKDETRLSTKLAQQQDEVIATFGGLTNMIDLCLTHANAASNIDTECKQFERFKQLLRDDNDDGNNNDKNITIINPNNEVTPIDDNSQMTNTETQTQTKTVIEPLNQNTNAITLTTDTNRNTTINTNIRSNHSIVDTTSEYNDFTLIIDCLARNSLCYELFDDSMKSLALYNFILNKKLIYSICTIGFISFLIYWVYNQVTGSNFSRGYFMFPAMIVLIYNILILLTANIVIIKLVTNTFDFWFKIYNIILLFLSMWIRASNDKSAQLAQFNVNNGAEVFATVISQIALFIIAVTLFLIDSLDLSIKLKRICICVCVICLVYNTINIYFFSNDYQWNPFGNHDFDHTLISFKSILLSSYINLIIFIAKPVGSDTMRYFKSKLRHARGFCHCCVCCQADSDDNNNSSRVQSIFSQSAGGDDEMGSKQSSIHTGDNINGSMNPQILASSRNEKQLQRCGTVYKRPFLKWN